MRRLIVNRHLARVASTGRARAVERVRHHLRRGYQRLAPAPAAMMEVIVDAWVAQAVAAAAALGVADALADGPVELSVLAERVGADRDALGRLMRALTGRGIFRHFRDGRYGLTPLGDTLRRDAPASMRGAALFLGSVQHREHWSYLDQAIRTGSPVVPGLRGKDFFDYLRDEPDLAEIVNDAMTSSSKMAVPPVVAGYDFSRFRAIVDVGGGHGALLAAILAATPAARGVLFDLPDVVAGAAPHLEQNGVADRVRAAGGSFFDGVPPGGDLYLLKHIIHDWDDEQAARILRSVAVAAGRQATVLVIEFVIPDHDRDFSGNWGDLEMLLTTGSRERSAAQYRTLMARAGLRMTRLIPTASAFSVIEARPLDDANPVDPMPLWSNETGG